MGFANLAAARPAARLDRDDIPIQPGGVKNDRVSIRS